MIRSLDVRLGTFHKVAGVAVSEDCVSILGRDGAEMLLPVRPHFNPRPQPIQVRGEFGDFSEVQGGEILRGIEAQDITAIEVVPEFADPDEDFHTRLLRLRSATGLNLTWELYCDGNSTKTR